MSIESAALKSVSILRNLTEEEIALLHDLVRTREYQPKEQILEEGKPVHYFYMICDGLVHVKRLAQQQELLLGRLGRDDFFGEINLFDTGVATASVYAVKKTLVALIQYADFRAFMAANPHAGFKILEAIMTEMAHRLRHTDTRLVLSVYWNNLKLEED